MVWVRDFTAAGSPSILDSVGGTGSDILASGERDKQEATKPLPWLCEKTQTKRHKNTLNTIMLRAWQEKEAWSRYFLLSLASRCLFLIGSVMYVWLEFISLDYEKKAAQLPTAIRQADDDASWYQSGWADDDYVYVSPNAKFYLSRYMIICFDAAMAFVITGILDWFVDGGILSIVMMLAGAFGLVSAMLVEQNEWLFEVMSAGSVHLFFLVAVGQFYRHFRRGKSGLVPHSLLYVVLFGNLCWILGSLMDVVLSYYAVLGLYRLRHSYSAVCASFGWLLCSLVYLATTINEELALRKKLAREAIPKFVDFTKSEELDDTSGSKPEPSLDDDDDDDEIVLAYNSGSQREPNLEDGYSGDMSTFEKVWVSL
jgi:hypothetical protein